MKNWVRTGNRAGFFVCVQEGAPTIRAFTPVFDGLSGRPCAVSAEFATGHPLWVPRSGAGADD
jgi:hypothetical protein